jgi:ribosomal protein L37E
VLQIYSIQSSEKRNKETHIKCKRKEEEQEEKRKGTG